MGFGTGIGTDTNDDDDDDDTFDPPSPSVNATCFFALPLPVPSECPKCPISPTTVLASTNVCSDLPPCKSEILLSTPELRCGPESLHPKLSQHKSQHSNSSCSPHIPHTNSTPVPSHSSQISLQQLAKHVSTPLSVSERALLLLLLLLMFVCVVWCVCVLCEFCLGIHKPR